PPAVTAATAVAERAEHDETVWLSGAVEPLRRVQPGTKILGRVAAVSVEEGQRVRRGEVLARLESADLDAAVGQAEAAVAMAEATRENAEVHEARLRDLHSRGSVTDKNLEDAVAGLRTAEAALARAEAAVAAARVTLSYARVVAPFDGWVVGKHVEAGDMARPGEPMFTIDDLSQVKVTVGVPEALRQGLAAGSPARVEVLGGRRDAVVDRIVPAGDPASRTFTVRLLLDNADGDLEAGLFARAGLPAATDTQAGGGPLMVPPAALVERGQLRGVFVVGDDAIARLRFLRLGRVTDDGVVVLSGLDAGERYLSTPPVGLLDGTPIREGA
ncbi:MAG: efflux RND transporter periplasmic adaptor subunit, partial [Acidobacteriota bacterium]